MRGRDVHFATAEAAAVAAQMPGDDQCDRESPGRRRSPHRQCYPPARSGDGRTPGSPPHGSSPKAISARSTVIRICGPWPPSSAVNRSFSNRSAQRNRFRTAATDDRSFRAGNLHAAAGIRKRCVRRPVGGLSARVGRTDQLAIKPGFGHSPLAIHGFD